MSGDTSDKELHALAAGGGIAAGLSAELVRPLRELREVLAVVVEHLDTHVSEASGPTPLPWGETRLLREKLAKAYLNSRRVSRLMAELAEALHRGDSPIEVLDLNKLVETAINLTRHRISAGTELFIDLGSQPSIKAPASPLLLVICHMISIAADSARSATGAAISVKTRRQTNEDLGCEVISVYVADNGAGQPERVDGAVALALDVVEPLGGSFSGTSEQGTGSVFELRVPIRTAAKRGLKRP